jgi:hypothetical protein
MPESLVRLGGFAGLLFVAFALTLNVVLTPASPDFNAPLEEIAAYVSEHASVLAVANALRYVVYFLLPFYAVGLYRFVRGSTDGTQAWATVGLLAAVWILAIGTVANSVETAGLWQADSAAQRPQLLLAVWGISGALFITVQLAWGTLTLACSVAGRRAGVVPVWLLGLGLVTFLSCLAGSVGVLSVMNGGWAQVPAFSSFAAFPLWVAITSVLMIRASWSSEA